MTVIRGKLSARVRELAAGHAMLERIRQPTTRIDVAAAIRIAK